MIDTNEIYHHGVTGMKWGKRNGPPYPLNEKGQAKLAKQKASNGPNNYGLAAEIGLYVATLAGLTLADVAISKAVSAGTKKIQDMRAEGRFKKKVKQLNKERDGKVDEKTGLRLKSKEMTVDEDLKKVNPTFDKAKNLTTINCVACGITFEMRRRGYDVNAAATDSFTNALTQIPKCFPGAKLKTSDPYKLLKSNNQLLNKQGGYNIENTDANKETVRQMRVLATASSNFKTADAVIDQLKKEKNARGVLLVNWGSGGGHCLNYMTDANGKLEILDGQINHHYDDEAFIRNKLLSRTIFATSVRLDKCDVDVKAMKGAFLDDTTNK